MDHQDAYIIKTIKFYNDNKIILEEFSKNFKNQIESLIKQNNKNNFFYSILSRVKNEESLRKKIYKLYREDKLNQLYDEDIFYRITDIIGVRIICRFLDDIKEIDKIIRDSDSFTIKSKDDSPQVEAYVIDREDIPYLYKNKYKIVPDNKNIDECEWVYDEQTEKKIFEIKQKPMRYTSIHYLIIPKKDTEKIKSLLDKGFVIELQVRSLLQESWAELEHDASYKTFAGENTYFKEISEILHPLDKFTMYFRDLIKDERYKEPYKTYLDRVDKQFYSLFNYHRVIMEKIIALLPQIRYKPDLEWLVAKLNFLFHLPELYQYLLLIDYDLETLYNCFIIFSSKSDEMDIIISIKQTLIKNFFINIQRRRQDQYLYLLKSINQEENEVINLFINESYKNINIFISNNIFNDLEEFLINMFNNIIKEKDDPNLFLNIVRIILDYWPNVKYDKWINIIKNICNEKFYSFMKLSILEIILTLKNPDNKIDSENREKLKQILSDMSAIWHDDDLQNAIAKINT